MRARLLCFHCFNSLSKLYRAKWCSQKPVCGICSGRQATLFHGLKSDPQFQQSTLSSDALPFCPKPSAPPATQQPAMAATAAATDEKRVQVVKKTKSKQGHIHDNPCRGRLGRGRGRGRGINDLGRGPNMHDLLIPALFYLHNAKKHKKSKV